MVFLKLFLRLPVVLWSSPLKILEGFCCGIHSNRIHVIRNDLICFIEEGLFCLYNGRKTDRIWNYIFQRGQSSMVAIGPGRLCLVKIYIYEKTIFWLKIIWHKIGPSKNCHISPSYTIGHGVSNDAKYSVVYSSHLSMMGTRNWCVTSKRSIFAGITSGRPYTLGNKNRKWWWIMPTHIQHSISGISCLSTPALY